MVRPRTYRTLKILRSSEIRPVEFLAIYLDPNSTGTPDFAFVNQMRDMYWNGIAWTALAWTRGPLEASNDQRQTNVSLGIDDMGKELQAQAQYLNLAGARVEIYRAFVGDLADPDDAYTIFIGKGKDPSFVVGTMSWECIGWLDMIDGVYPRRQLQRGCNYTLGGPGCGVTLSSFLVTGTAETGSSDELLVGASFLTQTDSEYWAIGYVEITTTTSPMVGVQRPIWKFDPTLDTIRVKYPFPGDITGLAVKVVPGCKKTKDDCFLRYNNSANYGGFAEVPKKPEVPIGKKG
jgi:hypothetical protein